MFLGTFFTLESASSTDILAHVTSLFTDSWVLIALAAGIPLAFWAIHKVMAILPKAKGSRRGRE